MNTIISIFVSFIGILIIKGNQKFIYKKQLFLWFLIPLILDILYYFNIFRFEYSTYICFGVSLIIGVYFIIINYNNTQKILAITTKLKSIFKEIPYEYYFDKNYNCNKVIVANPEMKITEKQMLTFMLLLEKQFDQMKWAYEQDIINLSIVYEGTLKPPRSADRPSSSIRPLDFIPLGRDGQNELGWNINKGDKNIADEYAELPANVMSSAPQCLTVGATGGGKCLYINQKIEILKEV